MILILNCGRINRSRRASWITALAKTGLSALQKMVVMPCRVWPPYHIPADACSRDALTTSPTSPRSWPGSAGVPSSADSRNVTMIVFTANPRPLLIHLYFLYYLSRNIEQFKPVRTFNAVYLLTSSFQIRYFKQHPFIIYAYIENIQVLYEKPIRLAKLREMCR